MAGESIRTFTAIAVSEEVRRAVARMVASLRTDAAGVRWTDESNLHLTFQFLGDVSTNDILTICDAVEAAVGEHEPFELSVRGVGAFPNLRRPRILWAGVEEGAGAEAAVFLHESLDAALEPFGYRKETRPYVPHLTIGRVKAPRPMPSLTRAFESLGDWQGGILPVEEVLVMASKLSSRGPAYSVLSRHRLRGG